MRDDRREWLARAGIAGFVDLHSHVLPAMDDGPAGPADSLRMLEAATRCGTIAMVATPHAGERYPFRAERRDEALRDIQAEAETAETLETPATPALFGGAEIELSPGGLAILWGEPDGVSIGGSRYVLIEAPAAGFATAMDHAMPRIATLGLQPILAHPERLRSADLEVALGWRRSAGLRLQLTGSALAGGFGRRIETVAWSLLDAGHVDFIASDAHDTSRRSPNLYPAFQRVCQRSGPGAAADLFAWNPLAVLASSGKKVSATAG